MEDKEWITKFENVTNQLKRFLNDAKYFTCENINALKVGDLLMVSNDDDLARGKIKKIYMDSNSKSLIRNYFFTIILILKPFSAIDVFLFDYGPIENFNLCDLKILLDVKQYDHAFSIPPRCFECTLTEIQPSSMKSRYGWLQEAIDTLQHKTENKVVSLDVYSIVNEVVSARLFVDDVDINCLLLEKGFAQYSEENCMSKANFDFRRQRQTGGTIEYGPAVEFREVIDKINTTPFNAPPMNLCFKKVKLTGPFTPLESKLYSITNYTEKKSVSIDQYSVNSIILNTDPEVNIFTF